MSTESLPFVSVVIPVYNEEQYIASCLESLTSLNYPKERYEILLVDNGSSDKTLDIARSFSGINIYIKEGVKVGAVRNYGVRKAKGSVIAFLDSDCVVDENWLTEGVNRLAGDPKGVIGGWYLLREDPSWIEKYWVLGVPKPGVKNELLGGCIFIQKDIFERVGGFDERLNAGEDGELTTRLKNSGYKVEIDLSLSVIHLGYPNRLWPFLARQLWHSSDYISGLPYTLRDKIFILTLVFMAGCFGLLSSFLFFSDAHFTLIITSSLVFLSPLVLSIKRTTRVKDKYNRLFDYFSIYLVDFLYLIGRSLGVLSGAMKYLTFRSQAKVGRR